MPDAIPAGQLGARSTVSASPHVAAVELDGEAVLYHEQLRIVCVLDPTATLIWNSLDGEDDLATIAEQLAAQFGAPVGEVTDDVVTGARDLGARGLLADVAADPDVLTELAVEGPEAAGPPGDG